MIPSICGMAVVFITLIMLACLYQPASKSNVFNILFPKHKRIFRLNCVLLYTQTINVLKKSPEHLEINL